MATAIEKYKDAKADHGHCRAWASLIGSRFHGGGGGIGYLHSLCLASGEAAPTVYHQRSDGAKNYHTMPKSLQPHLEAAIKARFGALLRDALERQEQGLKASAELAMKEHSNMLVDAGLTTTGATA